HWVQKAAWCWSPNPTRELAGVQAAISSPMAWNADGSSWEETAIDATAEADFEAKALQLGLAGTLLVEGTKVPVPRLAACLRRAVANALVAALGPKTTQSLQVRVRPGGGSALAQNCPVGSSAFSFAALLEEEDEDAVDRLREHLLLEEAFASYLS
ncbi:unnamed protein product, partial [Effrenium voratum]